MFKNNRCEMEYNYANYFTMHLVVNLQILKFKVNNKSFVCVLNTLLQYLLVSLIIP